MRNTTSRPSQNGRRKSFFGGGFNNHPNRNSQNRNGRSGARGSSRGNQVMKPDFDLFIKKAKPVTVKEYKPEKNFEQMGLNEKLTANLLARKYTTPTPIQDQAIPQIMLGKDIIGIANTGTGKTAAFLLPLLNAVIKNNSKRILVLAPTRELAMQIEAEIVLLANHTGISSTLVVGGMPIYRQIEKLRKPKNFIVGTTGRTMDLVKQRKIDLASFDTVVLDEMDQMLDMGFLPDIEMILKGIRTDRQLLFFSATLDDKIKKVAFNILIDPVHVSVKTGQTTDNVEQNVIRHGKTDDKFDILTQMLDTEDISRAIVFENTKHGVKNIEQRLLDKGFKVVAIHGNKTQSQRKKALDMFKVGKAQIMLATNVAARGLDIPNVSHVINYSLPQSREDYIHRIGRTGRAGKTGFAYTFVPS